MLLKNLINGIPVNKGNIPLAGISSNSKKIKNNYIFFAIKGKKENGEKFIRDAIKKGASVIVCSTKCKFKDKDIFVIKKKNVRNFLSEVASNFYRLKPKNIIAVTGTNGKTSVADIFYQLFRLNNLPVASIGTLGIKYNNKILKTNLTSPDTISLHKNLNFLKKRGIDNVILEASSHGLDQQRLHHINFKSAVFTNFSQDHLDYHKNMKSYLNAKLILFRKILKKKSYVILDKNTKQFKILKKISKKRKLKVVDINEEFFRIKNYLPTFPEFKIKNLAMAILASKICGLKKNLIYGKIDKIKDVDGRLECVKIFPNRVKVFVDYAHTPDALQKSLVSLKNEYKKNISIVFGCGGDRDKKKRSLMSKIANNYCNKLYVTDDNPRSEDPKKIRNQILKYIPQKKRYDIANRSIAIKKSIKQAEPGEIILVAGKGHEETQIYKNKIYHISDKEIVKKIFIKSKKIPKKKLNNLENKYILQKTLGKSKSFYFSGLSIDSRTIRKDNLFLAIKGKKNNGNKFIRDAFRKGASCAVTDSNENKGNKIIKVKNSNIFLNSFAKLKRESSSANIIAITGSAGKTSLKNLLSQLLKKFGKTHFSPRSFNNHLGVPISLSNLNCSDKYGVFEVGMSKAGEIKNLTKLIQPHIGIITNIGEAHFENFRNKKGIAKAKSEIIENIRKGGTIILNRDDKFFKFLSKKAKLYKLKIISFGKHKDSNVLLKKVINKNENLEIIVKIKNQILDFELGDINIHNVLACLATLSVLKIDIKKIKSKLKNLEASEGRGKKYRISRFKKKFKFIDESYNASPLSVKNAILRFKSIKKEKFKKYLVLGDMLELGEKSKKFHEEISRVINNSDIDKVFVKGKQTIFTYKQLNKNKRGNILQNIEDVDLNLSALISNNDYLMIKGSNATGLNDYSKSIIRGLNAI